MERLINHAARWLSTVQGFLFLTALAVLFGGAGYFFDWSEKWQLAYTLFLSIAAYELAAILLVAGAKDTAAMQAKLDELIRASEKANNKLRGIEKED